MKLGELIIIVMFGFALIFALITCPFEELSTFNPLEWFANSVNGFFDWIINLFFGWMG